MEAFWRIVSSIESKGMHVLYDTNQRLMKVFARVDHPRKSVYEILNPKAEPSTYGPGRPHAKLWFVQPRRHDHNATVKYYRFGRQNSMSISLGGVFAYAEDDLFPLGTISFVGRQVPVPHRSEAVVRQDVDLHQGVTVCCHHP
jgi:hypothetical protein